MARRKYGSKAAYEAERSEYRRIRDMTEEEFRKERIERIAESNRNRLEEEGLFMFSMFLAAAMSSGLRAPDAAKQAEAAIEIIRARYAT